MKTETIIGKALKEIPEYARKLPRDLRQSLPRELDALIEKAAYISEYVDRLNSGDTHENAVTRAQKHVAKVRKALGYTFPGQGLASVRI